MFSFGRNSFKCELTQPRVLFRPTQQEYTYIEAQFNFCLKSFSGTVLTKKSYFLRISRNLFSSYFLINLYKFGKDWAKYKVKKSL